MQISEELIQKCLEKDRRAENQLYKSLFSFLMNICIRYKHDYDEAGISLNTIFIKVLSNLKSFDSKQAFLPWVKTVAIRQLIDEYRKQKRNKIDLPGTEIVSGKVEPVSYDQLEYKDLIRMIKSLPVITSEVFNLFAIDGYKHHEISEIMQITVGSSKWHLHSARKLLQEMLEKEEKKRVMKVSNEG